MQSVDTITFGLKVCNYDNLSEVISHIIKFDKCLSPDEIKQRIEAKEIVLYYNMSKDSDINLDLLFCKLIQALNDYVELELYEGESTITLEKLCDIVKIKKCKCEKRESRWLSLFAISNLIVSIIMTVLVLMGIYIFVQNVIFRVILIPIVWYCCSMIEIRTIIVPVNHVVCFFLPKDIREKERNHKTDSRWQKM